MADTTTTFIADPVTYLQNHPTGLSVREGADEFVMRFQSHTFGIQEDYSPTGTAYFGIQVSDNNTKYPGIGLHQITLVQMVTNHGIQYLPWKDDHSTFMQVDANATLFFTGPLQGCNIYIGDSGGNPIVFHTNYNSNPNPTGNEQIKRGMFYTASGLSNSEVSRGRLERGTYMAHGVLEAFVFGWKRPGGNWEFFYHSYSLGGGGTAVVHAGATSIARF